MSRSVIHSETSTSTLTESSIFATNNDYLNHLKEKANNSLSILKSLAEEYVKFTNPNYGQEFIYDHFAELKNQIDLHREIIIKEIHDKSD